MDKNYNFSSSPINGMQVNESFGKYTVSCKIGYLCDFNLMQISNQPHFHDCYELCIVTSGEGNFSYGNNVYKVKQGDIFVADSEVIHEISVSKLQDLQLIYFLIQIETDNNLSPKSIQDQSIESFLSGHKVITVAQKQMFAYFLFIDTYYSAKKSRGYGIEQALKSLILESIDLLAVKSERLLKGQLHSPNTFEAALDYIDHNLNNKITVSEVARQLNVSERTLQYLFKKYLNRTIVDYINEKKMVLAAHHLKKQFSVSETACQVGIGGCPQFTRLFKKYFGVGPKKYQQLHSSEFKDFGRRKQKLEII
ncbi:Transcriptional regulator, AraC family [Desulfosporosinus sp. I2]|uniref:AraC family transcriptional regulator n=1 Tax=Desulfosporosinus sp. I2 TaxID=1617025 RepID=UPI0005EFF786|nr:AraC family transcriptional regulator [Desulfosporosinus sp. I2]KJR44602.1 Transcriptional regulator, AraC family [Desulfosporosinus sp. I2]